MTAEEMEPKRRMLAKPGRDDLHEQRERDQPCEAVVTLP
jgi:hypothetical protein